MAWDSTRPVPWQRLAREWLIYVAIMAVVFVAFFRDRDLIGIFAGLLASGPLYLAFGYVMAKFGYQRRPLRGARFTSTTDAATPPAESIDTPRSKPAPTKRTGGGQRPNRPAKRRR